MEAPKLVVDRVAFHLPASVAKKVNRALPDWFEHWLWAKTADGFSLRQQPHPQVTIRADRSWPSADRALFFEVELAGEDDAGVQQWFSHSLAGDAWSGVHVSSLGVAIDYPEGMGEYQIAPGYDRKRKWDAFPNYQVFPGRIFGMVLRGDRVAVFQRELKPTGSRVGALLQLNARMTELDTRLRNPFKGTAWLSVFADPMSHEPRTFAKIALGRGMGLPAVIEAYGWDSYRRLASQLDDGDTPTPEEVAHDGLTQAVGAMKAVLNV